MGIEAKKEYLMAIRARYEKAGKSGKGAILNEFCEICGYSRKYAIRILSRPAESRIGKPGPKPTYPPEVLRHLKVLWIATNQICSKRLKAALPQWLVHYEDSGLSPEHRALLLKMSPATMDRLLSQFRYSHRKGLSATRAASPNLIKSRIPIELIIGREITRPGYVEGDTVAHCGNTLAGYFVNSLTMTDIFSGWTENRATWTKGQTPVLAAIKEIENALPFGLTGFASDNGTEFLNYEMVKYFRLNRQTPVEFVRRRPYKKNDNAHVEQKNWTHVRQLFGYDRIEDRAIVDLMNEIYREYWNPLQNFFTPAVKLIEKTRIGGKIKKKYDQPKTPYQRLLDCADLDIESKDKLRAQHQTLNPFVLTQGLRDKLKEFFEKIRRQQFWGSKIA